MPKMDKFLLQTIPWYQFFVGLAGILVALNSLSSLRSVIHLIGGVSWVLSFWFFRRNSQIYAWLLTFIGLVIGGYLHLTPPDVFVVLSVPYLLALIMVRKYFRFPKFSL